MAALVDRTADRWSLEEEAAAEGVHKDDHGMPVTMAWHTITKGKQKQDVFPEEIDDDWTVEQFVSERERIVCGVMQETPGVVFHGWIMKHAPRTNARMAVVEFVKPKKDVPDGNPIRCTLDPRLHKKWWWYGHRGTSGNSQASEIKSEPIVQKMDDLFV